MTPRSRHPTPAQHAAEHAAEHDATPTDATPTPKSTPKRKRRPSDPPRDAFNEVLSDPGRRRAATLARAAAGKADTTRARRTRGNAPPPMPYSDALPATASGAPPRYYLDDYARGIVEKAAAMGNSRADIAALVGIPEDQLTEHCAAEIAAGRARMRRKLRAWQLRHAAQGNAALLIWLGKNELGQREYPSDGEDVPTFHVRHSFDPAADPRRDVPDDSTA